MFVDTSVWSLAFRRDGPTADPRALRLHQALEAHEDLFTSGLVLQELLQGISGPRLRDAIIEGFRHTDVLVPELDDHLAAADLQARCRRGGVQIKTIDALLAALCVRRELVILTADRDFLHVARFADLRIWEPPA